jgi:pimeloyl-ACP methyl ester carboxylesterase
MGHPRMKVHEYGVAGPAGSGPVAIAIHGGPGAPGDVADLAQGLADAFHVLEPYQRSSGGAPLTVARHVEDLRDLVLARGLQRPALVGSSWGAMLALAFSAAHPDMAGPLVLVGCGTFDEGSRARFRAAIGERQPCEPTEAWMARVLPLYSYDPIPSEPEPLVFDERSNAETWADMLRLQKAGIYPAAFAAIRGPVLMLHGAADPHPGRMILESLRPWLPRIEYREWERCGHYPWREKAVRGQFFATVKAWLGSPCAGK